MQVSTEMVRRLRDSLPALGITLPDGVRAVRCHHSRAERNNGAWSWTLRLPYDLTAPDAPVSEIGSQWAMRDLARCQDWAISRDSLGAVHVDLCTPCLTRGKIR